MKTTLIKPIEEWIEIDGSERILGRLAADIASILMGKHKAGYVPFMMPQSHVVVINAKNIKVTGNKEQQKIYHHFSGYPGGIRSRTLADVLSKDATWPLKQAVWNMLRKNRLRKKIFLNLHVYLESEHPYKDKLKISSKDNNPKR